MLQKISHRQFIKNLKKRKLENLSVISLIEQSLNKQRRFVFRMPKRGASVVLLLSGGLDSVTCWGILMKEFGLHVYPLSFDRGEKRANKEKESVDYFSKFYKNRYPSLHHAPVRLSLGVQNITIPIEHASENIHPEILLNKFTGADTMMDINISFGSFLLLPLYAKLYAEYLHHTQNLYVRTILCSVTLGDGLIVPHQTFTSLRSIMYYLCTATRDFSWQFTSAVFEKETGLYFDKSNLVEWANKEHIPIEKTWSCYHSKKYQCGGADCITCRARKDAFYKSGVADKTVYCPVDKQNFLNVIEYKVHNVLRRMQLFVSMHT